MSVSEINGKDECPKCVQEDSAPQATSDGKVFCQVKGHDFEDTNNCVFCAKDGVTISRECADYVLASIGGDIAASCFSPRKSGKTYRIKMYNEIKQALQTEET
jgi:hypothetical protein